VKTLITLIAFCVCASITAAAADATVTVTLDTKHPGLEIPSDFTGLSFEVALLLPGANGVHYFRPDNRPLLDLFRTLGIKNLRIGGNTSDRDAKRLPSEADFDSLFAFAKAADLKVIFCLRLHNGDPQEDAKTVKYIMDRYASQVDCFSIGQEPSAYPVEKRDTRAQGERMGAANEKYQYADYREDWKKFADAIISEVPNVKFCGPSVHNNADWARRFITDFRKDNHVSLITEHLYPGGAGGRVPTPEIGRQRMLSNDFVRAYQRLHDGFVPMAISNSLPYRLEEVNNYFNGGATNVSNTFASALWGLDFMYWWASHNAAGVNFHTGDRVATGSSLQPSKYTAFFSTTNGYVVRPLGYGIKAFELGSHGKFFPVNISDGTPDLNLSAYGVLGDAKTIYVTLINKAYGANAGNVRVNLVTPDESYLKSEIIFLAAPQKDITTTTGVSLGDAEIKNDANWSGRWKPLVVPPKKNQFATIVELPPASAAVVKLATN
jgi:hypothetical protein